MGESPTLGKLGGNFGRNGKGEKGKREGKEEEREKLIETLYRENVSFRDRDLKRQIPCHTASENLDAQLLRNDTSF